MQEENCALLWKEVMIMNLHEEQERVQKAVSNSLSHVQEDPWLTQRVLANAKGEEPVKRKISLALVMSIVGILAVMGTAYALFSSQVAEFFGQHWNRDYGDWLQGGKIAQIGETVTLGGVDFTLDEGTQALIAKAKETGGRMLTANSLPLKIGVDEGTMLMPGTVGFYDVANEDGSSWMPSPAMSFPLKCRS